MWRPRRWLSARYPRIPCLPPAISHTGERRGGISSYLTIFIFLNYPAPKYPVKLVPMEYLIFIILSITILSRGLFVHSLGSVPNRTSWRRTYATSRCPRHTKSRDPGRCPSVGRVPFTLHRGLVLCSALQSACCCHVPAGQGQQLGLLFTPPCPGVKAQHHCNSTCSCCGLSPGPATYPSSSSPSHEEDRSVLRGAYEHMNHSLENETAETRQKTEGIYTSLPLTPEHLTQNLSIVFQGFPSILLRSQGLLVRQM